MFWGDCLFSWDCVFSCDCVFRGDFFVLEFVNNIVFDSEFLMFGVDILLILLLYYFLVGEKVVSNWLLDNLLLVINFSIIVDVIVNGLFLNTLGLIDYNLG